MIFVLAMFVLSLLSGCSRDDRITSGELEPVLIFESDSEDENYSFTAARNIAVDSAGNLYIFDYLDNTIKKYDRNGNHAVTFGSRGEGPGQFSHLMEIRVFGNVLLALDSVGTLVFSLDGNFVEKSPFQEEIVCGFPQIYADGRFLGELYSQSELTKSLTLRGPRGGELDRLAQYDLREFFPDLEEGKDFFLQDYQARFYLYSFRDDGSVIWASSDECKVYSYKNDASTMLFAQDYTPLPIPADQVADMERSAERASQNPMLHMYVPQSYQIVQHLLSAPDGDILVYVMSAEKTGFLVYTSDGELKGHYSVNADFDMTRVKTQIFDSVIYYIVPGRDSVEIYASQID
jgi:hypothetical protein